MAGEPIHHDLGEVWGKVENLEKNFSSLTSQVETGFNRVFEAINTNTDKTERRISEFQRETNTRFETEASSYRRSTEARSATALQVIGYLLTAFIGLGGLVGSFVGLAVTFYTLTKAPIDQTFSRQDQNIAANSASIQTLQDGQSAALDKTRDRFEAQSADFEKKLADFVPKGEVKTNIDNITKIIDRNTVRLDALEKYAADGGRDRQAIHETIRDLLTSDKEIRASIVPRAENENRFADLISRIDKLFDRLNIVQNNLEAGNKVGDRLNRLSDQVEQLTNKFIVVPSFPKYRAPDEQSR